MNGACFWRVLFFQCEISRVLIAIMNGLLYIRPPDDVSPSTKRISLANEWNVSSRRLEEKKIGSDGMYCPRMNVDRDRGITPRRKEEAKKVESSREKTGDNEMKKLIVVVVVVDKKVVDEQAARQAVWQVKKNTAAERKED